MAQTQKTESSALTEDQIEEKKAKIAKFFSEVEDFGFAQEENKSRKAKFHLAKQLAMKSQCQGAIRAIKAIETKMMKTIANRENSHDYLVINYGRKPTKFGDDVDQYIEEFWAEYKKHNNLLGSYILTAIIDALSTPHSDPAVQQTKRQQLEEILRITGFQ